MKSELPKVMHPLAGQPLIEHVLRRAEELKRGKIYIVLGHGREKIAAYLGQRATVVVQEQQLGSGHALQQAACFLREEETVLVLSGDQPLLRRETLETLLQHHEKTGAGATVLTAEMPDPFGYGRIVKQNGVFTGIVEQKDATEEQQKIREINTGTYCFQAGALKRALARLQPKNAQGEYYLTDVFGFFLQEGLSIETLLAEDVREAMGINDRAQLAEAEGILLERIRAYWMREGVTLTAPETIFIEPDVKLEQDVTILPFSILKGKTVVQRDVVIGPRTVLEDCLCRAGCAVESSTARQAEIGENCVVGPYAYLRPGTVLEKNVKVGDFAEIKNSRIGEGSKVPHLSYIGDALVGKHVNIGAGTITCNYDGKEKHETHIGDGAFVGSNTNFVAPVQIGAYAMIGAGSTITGNVPENALGLERARQRNIENWRAKKTE